MLEHMNVEQFQKSLINESKEIEDYVIKIRRQIHMNPEVGYEEHQTSALIVSELEGLGYTIQKTAITGIIATLDSGKEGKTIGLRADMDALNVTEDNEVEYCSKIPGKMHACGHDTHVAMLLGAAKLISK